jgi:hypothetical protein
MPTSESWIVLFIGEEFADFRMVAGVIQFGDENSCERFRHQRSVVWR